MKKLTSFNEWLSEHENNTDESTNESLTIGTVAVGLMVGYIGIKVLQSVAKAVVGAVGMNVQIPPDKLKTIINNVMGEVIEKSSGVGLAMAMIYIEAFKQEIYADIDSGKIKTIADAKKKYEKLIADAGLK